MNVSVIGECKSLEGLYLVLVYYRFFLPQLMDGLTIWIFFLLRSLLLFPSCFFLHTTFSFTYHQRTTTTYNHILVNRFPPFPKATTTSVKRCRLYGQKPILSLSHNSLDCFEVRHSLLSLYSADCQPLLLFFTAFASY